MTSDYCRDIVVLGTVGTGKSSLCNSLLGRKAFEVMPFSLGNVTQEVEKKSSMDIVVTDTPGLLDNEKSIADIALKILSDRNGCPYPHAFLIVFDASKRMRNDYIRIMDLLRIVFGKTCLSHAIVVFTMVNDKLTDDEFESFWKQNKDMQQLIAVCGRRVARIDNQSDEKMMRAKEIIQLVDKLSDKGKKRFDLPLKSIHVKVLTNYQTKQGNVLHQNANDIYDAGVKQIADALAEEYYSFSKQEESLRVLMIMVVFICAVVAIGVCFLLVGKIAFGCAFLTSGLLGIIVLFYVSPATILRKAVKIENIYQNKLTREEREILTLVFISFVPALILWLFLI